MSWRKIIFFSMFLVVPAAFWKWGVVPLSERRAEALAMQQNADKQIAKNKRVSEERDQLEILWDDFRPQAELELISLGTHLDPILLQNHVLDLARRLSCDLKIQSNASRDGAELPTYSFSGSGAPWQAHEFLRYLERGDHRARYTAVTVVYAKLNKTSEIMAYFSGEFTIPSVPDAPKNPDLSEDLQTGNMAIPTVASGQENIG